MALKLKYWIRNVDPFLKMYPIVFIANKLHYKNILSINHSLLYVNKNVLFLTRNLLLVVKTYDGLILFQELKHFGKV